MSKFAVIKTPYGSEIREIEKTEKCGTDKACFPECKKCKKVLYLVKESIYGCRRVCARAVTEVNSRLEAHVVADY